MRDTELSARDHERHREVYATSGLPGFKVNAIDERLLSGRNPLTVVDVAELADRGVTHVLDLREEHEWRAAGRFGAEAVEELGRRGIERRNVVVKDCWPPTPAMLDDVVAWIEGVLAQPNTRVFVHCRAGRERTGSVLAAVLASRGMPVESALLLLKDRCGAAPLPAQEAAVRDWATERASRRTSIMRERIRGCFLGGAIGDALGAPVEFDSLATIRRKFGPAGVTGFLPAYGTVGAITDDTQMTLFTAEGLIRGSQRWNEKGICHIASVVRYAYLRWLDTQGDGDGVPGVEDALGRDVRGWLVDEPVLRHRREPGKTCISGLRTGRFGSREQRLNDSKGCGGVMRVAPVGLVMAIDPFEQGCEMAALTHGHPSGFLAAGAFAVAIRSVVNGAAIRDAVVAARRAVAADAEGAEVVAAIDKALAAADKGIAPEILESLGGGWVAEEALAITFYCALVEPDPRRALLLAVNHSGDSDSTGSMVGQLLGAALGVRELPAEWIVEVEARDVIERLAEDFAVRFVDDRSLPWATYPGT